MSAGDAEDRQQVRDLQHVCQFDDPIVIQFTSVSGLNYFLKLVSIGQQVSNFQIFKSKLKSCF